MDLCCMYTYITYILYTIYTVSLIYTHITLYIYLYLLYLPVFLHSLMQGISKCQHKHFGRSSDDWCEANIAGWKSSTFQKQNTIKSLRDVPAILVYWSVLLMITCSYPESMPLVHIVVTVLADIFATLFWGGKEVIAAVMLATWHLFVKQTCSKKGFDGLDWTLKKFSSKAGEVWFSCRWCINRFEDH